MLSRDDDGALSVRQEGFARGGPSRDFRAQDSIEMIDFGFSFYDDAGETTYPTSDATSGSSMGRDRSELCSTKTPSMALVLECSAVGVRLALEIGAKNGPRNRARGWKYLR